MAAMNVVEVMRDARGEAPERLELLRLHQRGLRGLAPLDLGREPALAWASEAVRSATRASSAALARSTAARPCAMASRASTSSWMSVPAPTHCRMRPPRPHRDAAGQVPAPGPVVAADPAFGDIVAARPAALDPAGLGGFQVVGMHDPCQPRPSSASAERPV
jgi:hypothetical protein